ncbi:MAG: protein kinase domain-containing protein [Nodosilinea sp.]
MSCLCFNLQCPHPLNPSGVDSCQACGADLRIHQRYRCRSLLGQGGFGRTYLAIDEQSQPPQPCVVKQMAATNPILPPGHRFRLEAEQLAHLGQHPQIPQLLGVVDNAQGQFLIQEYIPGPNLEQLLQTRLCSEADIRQLLQDILPVLQFIHDQQVIHRDIKPANLIMPPPPRPVVLVDFGASKALYPEESAPQTGTVIGSAGYAAPEQTLGKAVFASDIYSLGLTCLHLLTGLHPFDLYSIGEDGLVWRPFLPSPVSPALGRLLDRMVNRSLKERYTSAQQVLADLRWVGPQVASPSIPQETELRPLALQAWQPAFTLESGRHSVSALAFSPNGRALATAATDGTVYLWDIANGERLYRFGASLGPWGIGHRSQVTAMVFTPDGQRLITGDEKGQLIEWNLAQYRQRHRLPLTPWGVCAMLLTADGKILVVGSGDGRIYLCQRDQDYRSTVLIHHQERIIALALGPGGGTLVSASGDRTIRFWSLPTGYLIHTVTTSNSLITALAGHPQDDRVVSGDQFGRVQLWSPGITGEQLGQFTSPVTALTLSPDGQWLGLGLEKGQISILRLPWQGSQEDLVVGWPVHSLAFSPDSRIMVSGGSDGMVQAWLLTID